MTRRLYELALLAYPRRFRREFAADLTAIFTTRVASARAISIGRALAVSGYHLADALLSGFAERGRAVANRWAWPNHSIASHSQAPTMTLDTFVADLKLSIRQFARTPLFAALTILTLALGIGANSAIFGVVHAVLLRPLPYAAPDRLVAIWSDNTKQSVPDNPVSPANYEAFRSAPSFAGVEAMYSFLISAQLIVDGGDPEPVQAMNVTPGMWSLLGRAPLHGATFTATDTAPVMVLSYDYWQRRFGGDPRIVGRTVTLRSVLAPVTIGGVMPQDFVFPYRSMLGPAGFSRAQHADLWLPLTPQADTRLRDQTGQPNRSLHYLSVIARLRPGATLEQAGADLRAIAARRAADFPDTNAGWDVTVRPLHEQAVGRLRPAILTLLAGVGVVLLMTCINVANVLLARATGRHRDLAIRAALGASRWRLMQQTLVESVLLGLAGGAGGLVLMMGVTQVVLALAPPELPRLGEVTASVPVLVFAAVTSLAVGVAIGLLAAVAASRSRAPQALRENTRTTASASRQRLRALLIVAEVALAMALTVGAGLLLRSFVGVLGVDPGFQANRLLTFQMTVPPRVQQQPASLLPFYDDLERRLASLPGVTHVGGTTRLPLGSTSVTTYIEVDGRPVPTSDRPEVEFRRALFDYFGAMGIPIIQGRNFSADDGSSALPVTIINATLASRLFPQENPVGRRIRPTNSPWLTIVGVAGDIRHNNLEDAPRPELYITYRQGPPTSPFVAIRTTADPASLASAVRGVFRDLGADPPRDLRSMDEIRSASVGERRFVLVLVGIFGMLAMLLAGVGVFGVITLVASERAPEVGIRLALGATPSAVLGLMLAYAVKLTAVGVVIGGLVALALAPALGAQLFGIGRADPITYVAVTAVLLAVATLAALVPGRRAMRVHPATTLKSG